MKAVGRATALVAVIGLIVALGTWLVDPSRPVWSLREGWWMLRRGWLVLRGELVDVGGYRLRIVCKGTGQTTIVLESGLCQPLRTWSGVDGALAQLTRVCMYDRAGVGMSDMAAVPRTGERMVEDLNTLLTNAGVAPPYVLVGHSAGGLIVRLYAHRYAEKVTGLVLIDTAHEDQFARFAALLPPEAREKFWQHERGQNCERIDLEALGNEVRVARHLAEMPLTVLTVPPRSERWPAHREMQDDLAHLVQTSRHVVVEGTGHFVQYEKPEVVIEAVRGVLEASRARSAAASR